MLTVSNNIAKKGKINPHHLANGNPPIPEQQTHLNTQTLLDSSSQSTSVHLYIVA